jgi:hypothetical protein
VISQLAFAVLAATAAAGHEGEARAIPVCTNPAIVKVVRRAGCTLGDGRCWARNAGFCTDWIEQRLSKDGIASPPRMEQIPAQEVRAGDVAVFVSRSHYAYVEAVVKDESGKPVALELSEYNYGRCWVDRDFLVTDQYKVAGRRSGVPLREVDGGFLRARRGAR